MKLITKFKVLSLAGGLCLLITWFLEKKTIAEPDYSLNQTYQNGYYFEVAMVYFSLQRFHLLNSIGKRE